MNNNKVYARFEIDRDLLETLWTLFLLFMLIIGIISLLIGTFQLGKNAGHEEGTNDQINYTLNFLRDTDCSKDITFRMYGDEYTFQKKCDNLITFGSGTYFNNPFDISTNTFQLNTGEAP